MRIHAITTGRVRIKQAQIEGRGHGLMRQLRPILSPEWSDWLPVHAFAIEHPEGVIVVDTGANAGLKSLPRWHPYFQFSVQFDIEPEQELGPQLRSLGIAAHDVKTVVLTHLHIDHDGGVGHFYSSRFVANANEIARASGLRGAILGYLPNRWPEWFTPETLQWQQKPLGPFRRHALITKAADVIAVSTPGHTPDHVSVLVRDGDAHIMIAGDASYREATMLSGTIDGVSPDEAVARTTLGSIRSFCARRPTIYLPAHDPETARRLDERRTTRTSSTTTAVHASLTSTYSAAASR